MDEFVVLLETRFEFLRVSHIRGDNGQRLDVSAAVRFSDYDLFSSETVSKLGINFAPTDDIVFRASYSEGSR